MRLHQTLVRVALCTFVSAVCIMACHLAQAQLEEVLNQPTAPALDKTKIDELRAQLAQPVPANATRAFWDERYKTAIQSGDPVARRLVIEQALASLKDESAQKYYFAEKWYLTREFANPIDALALGEQYLQRWPGLSSNYFILARDYLATQNLERAEYWKNKGEALLKPPIPLSLQNSRVKLDIVFAQARGQFEDALKLSKKRVEIADQDAATRKPTDSYYFLMQRSRFYVRLSLSGAYRKAGLLAEARDALADAARVAQELSLGGTEQLNVLTTQGWLDLAAGNFSAALAAMRLSESQLSTLGSPDTSEAAMSSRAAQISALEGLGRFDEAVSIGKKLDGLAGDNALLQKRVGSGMSRAVAFWRTGDIKRAEISIGDAAKSYLERYGPDHYFTLRAQAMLRAIQLQRQPDPLLLAELGTLCTKLLAANSTRDPEAIDQVYRRHIFEAYLKALADSGSRDLTSINTGFQLADAMRESRVGKVVTEAAQRSVAKQTGLGDLVKRQTDLKFALNASYENLAIVMSRSKEERDENVLADLRKTLQAQQTEQLQVEKDIATRYPEFNQLTAGTAVQLTDTIRLLNRSEALISIQPGNDATYVWVVTRDQAPLFYASKLTEADLRERVARLRKTLDVGDIPPSQIPPFDTTTAAEIYRELLAPAQAQLEGRSSLIVNAAGPLGQIPFATLVTGPVTAQGVPWLLRRYAITHMSSIGAFQALRQSSFRTPATHAFIGFGDPQFAADKTVVAQTNGTRAMTQLRAARSDDTAPLLTLRDYARVPPLPETRDEILAIAKALGADTKTDVFFGKAASRTAVLNTPLADIQIIAFSTHGLMSGDLPGLTQPALALAAPDKEGDNPLLLLEDIMSLKLNADWVILSACNTAAADGQASEAISGLGRGFFYAGARALLVTHWAVESESAKELVSGTFKRYGSDKSLSRAEALRRAQLDMIDGKRFSHPFFWAPYALVGDGG
jgi:CHAT domain-containing protein